MSSHILLNSLIALFFVMAVSRLLQGVLCVRVQKKYGIDVRPKFNGSHDIDKKYLKSLIDEKKEAEYVPDLKRILLIRKVNGISFLLFAGGILSIFLLSILT